MPLDDKLKDDGSFIDELDSKILQLNRRIGDYWQNKTHMSVYTLQSALYTSAIVSFVDYWFQTNSYAGLAGIVGAISLAASSVKDKLSQDLPNEFQFELMGLPKKILKYFDVGTYLIGSYYTMEHGIKLVLLKFFEGVPYSTSRQLFVAGLGMFSLATALYFDKIKFDEPPKLKRNFKQWLKDKVAFP